MLNWPDCIAILGIAAATAFIVRHLQPIRFVVTHENDDDAITDYLTAHDLVPYSDDLIIQTRRGDYEC